LGAFSGGFSTFAAIFEAREGHCLVKGLGTEEKGSDSGRGFNLDVDILPQ